MLFFCWQYLRYLKPLTFKTFSSKFNYFRGNSLRRVKNGIKWRVKDISIDQTNQLNRNSANLSTTELSPALLAQANWTFVEKLLKVIIFLF